MKSIVSLITLLVLSISYTISAADDTETPMPSAVHEWDDIEVQKIPNGLRRFVFNGKTTELDNLHCHITTLNVGETSGEPRLHESEEIIIVKEGQVEFTHDGVLENAGPGSIVFFAANAVTRLRNIGDTQATYYVIYYTPMQEAE